MLATIFISTNGNSWSTASGMTQESNFDGNSLQDTVLTSSGPTGTTTVSDSLSQGDAVIAITVALK
jgi:hypothetical protein